MFFRLFRIFVRVTQFFFFKKKKRVKILGWRRRSGRRRGGRGVGILERGDFGWEEEGEIWVVRFWREGVCVCGANPALHVDVWCSLLSSGFAQCVSGSSRLAFRVAVPCQSQCCCGEGLAKVPRRLRRRSPHRSVLQTAAAVVVCM